MTVAVVAEKPSAARKMATALGGTRGTYSGTPFLITSLRGHLYEFADPVDMLKDPGEAGRYRSWDLANLPWDPDAFTWKRKAKEGTSQMLRDLKKTLSDPSVDEIAIATDIDPTGEGDLLFWEVADELGLHHKKFTRMEFVDEAPASIQKAFANRRPVRSMQDEGAFRKADARSKMDLLTMQHTRIATTAAAQRAVLRQGRLKSAMVKLVGDQLKAYNEYVRKPFFQNRFRDENGVVYTSADEPRFDQQGQVPQSYGPGPVARDRTTQKTTAPPRLLDLAALSARLSGKGVKAAVVLQTYQKMYEDQVVSYPRTEDKTITREQFAELAKNAPRIAAVVGVDPALLTHTAPRKTHVKDAGAHGANRPGPSVPASLDALKAKYGPAGPLIYEILARNSLAMLAEDYAYERQEGHVAEHPAFIGSANVPKAPGWKAVFGMDLDEDGDENAAGLGERAEPFVFEGANARPPAPTMKWLMTQLEKHDVGTGATRTSIYADVTASKHKFPLLSENRGRIDTTEYGRMSYLMLPGTRIGDLGATEQFYSMMKDIEKGTRTTDEALALVTGWVTDDLETMRHNAANMRKELDLSEMAPAKEKAEGTWKGKATKFSREWGGHRFTDAEVADLLAGKVITFKAKSKAGNDYVAKGQLAEQTFTADDGRKVDFTGFKPDFSGIPASFCQHTFTADETAKLEAGEKIYVEGMISKKGNEFSATLSYGKKPNGEKGLILDFG